MIAERRDFDLLLGEPLKTAGGTVQSREGTLLRVEDAGSTGVGEATPLPGWTESIEDCRDAIERAIDRVDGGRPEAALDAPAARHGVSLALLDLAARQDGTPLYRHLADGDLAEHVESVPVNATVGDASAEASAGRAIEAVAAGFRTVKVKVGARSVEADADRLHAIRSAVGDDVRLRADANGSWSREEARRAVEAFPDLAYLEQPLDPEDLAGHADLREHVPIALDETLVDHSVEEALAAAAADVFVLKPMVLGGVDRAREAAETAREAGVDPVVTTTIDAVVARTAAVHLAAALDVDRACGLATAGMLAEDLAPDPATVADGRMSVPPGSGHGVTIE